MGTTGSVHSRHRNYRVHKEEKGGRRTSTKSSPGPVENESDKRHKRVYRKVEVKERVE